MTGCWRTEPRRRGPNLRQLLDTQYIFSPPVWNGRHDYLLLMQLELTPFDLWNVRIVAADRETATALDLARAYTDEIPGLAKSVERLIDELKTEHGCSSRSGSVHDDPMLLNLQRSVHGLAGALWEQEILPGLLQDD